VTDWYRASAGHYWRGLREQIMYRNREWAAAIGQEHAGWYYRRLLPTRRVVKGPFATLAQAMRAVKKT
jgi:hypothetical protein